MKTFDVVVGFTQEELMLSNVSAFMQDLVEHWLIYGRTTLKSFLPNHQRLGAHTGVIIARAGNFDEYIWSHPVNKPMGEMIAPQCPQCFRVRSFKKEREDDRVIVLSCKASGCPYRKEFRRPEHMTWLFEAPKGGKRSDSHSWLRGPFIH